MKLPPQAISILILNLLPVVSAALFGWSAFTLILLYWFENLVLGVLNVAKIVVTGFAKDRPASTTLLMLVPFASPASNALAAQIREKGETWEGRR